MIFEQIATGGCQSCLIGRPDSRAGAPIDPELRPVDRCSMLAARAPRITGFRSGAPPGGGMKAWRDAFVSADTGPAT